MPDQMLRHVRRKKHAGGRPTVMTEDVLRKLDEAFAWGCTDIEACLHADISERSLYDYQALHPEFAQRKEALKQKPYLIARKSIVDRMPKDPDLALKYMERKKKGEFSLRTETTGKDGGPVEVKAVEVLDVGGNKPEASADSADS